MNYLLYFKFSGSIILISYEVVIVFWLFFSIDLRNTTDLRTFPLPMRISSSVIVSELDDREVFTGSVKPVILLEDTSICFHDMSSVHPFYESKKTNPQSMSVPTYTGKLNNDNSKI